MYDKGNVQLLYRSSVHNEMINVFNYLKRTCSRHSLLLCTMSVRVIETDNDSHNDNFRSINRHDDRANL